MKKVNKKQKLDKESEDLERCRDLLPLGAHIRMVISPLMRELHGPVTKNWTRERLDDLTNKIDETIEKIILDRTETIRTIKGL